MDLDTFLYSDEKLSADELAFIAKIEYDQDEED